jgi:hypothetical protein
MAPDDGVGVMLTALGQMHFFTVVQRDEAVALEPVDHLRNGRGRKAQELRETRRNDVPVLVAQRVNRLEILLDRGCCSDC